MGEGSRRNHHRDRTATLTRTGRIAGAGLAVLLIVGGPGLAAARPRGPAPVVRVPAAVAKSAPARRGSVGVAARGVLVRFGTSVTRAGRAATVRAAGAGVADRLPGTGLYLVRVRAGADPVAVARRLDRAPGVRHAEPDWLSTPDLVPNDPLFSDQWGLQNVHQAHPVWDPPPATYRGVSGADGHVAEAWDTTEGDPGTVVAVIDSGVDLSHPDLNDNLWTNPGETAANGVDDDDNGYVDDVNGWDFYSGDDVPQDAYGHGTHVAGIVAAEADNGLGVAGVCPACQVMALRAGGANGTLPLSAILQAISYAWRNGADVINMSFGAHVWSTFERNAIATAGAHGVLVVASAGNDASDNDVLGWHRGRVVAPAFPASFDLPNVVSVAASNDRDFYGYATGCYARSRSAECLFTNWGRTSVDLAAPGVDIQSTWLGGAYQLEDGTSMAAPFVSGVAGLVKSMHPAYTPEQVKDAILNGVDRPANIRGRFSVTAGRVDAAEALTAPTTDATPDTDGTIEGAVPLGVRRSGVVAQPGDANDIYRRKLVRGRRYTVTLTVPPKRDFDLYVWKPGSVDTWPVTYGCGGISCQLRAKGVLGTGRDERVSFIARTTGVYFFHVTAFTRGGRYTLRLAAA